MSFLIFIFGDGRVPYNNIYRRRSTLAALAGGHKDLTN